MLNDLSGIQISYEEEILKLKKELECGYFSTLLSGI